MKMKKITVVILSIAMSGCAIFGPSYKKPDASSPDSFRSKDQLVKVDKIANLPDMAWWNKFNDPKLNELIIEALKNNNQIQMAIGNVIAAQGYLQQIEMGWVPTVNAAGGYSQSGAFNSTTNSSANSAAFGNGYNNGYSAGLVPGYTINVLQQYRMQQQAKAAFEAQKATKDAMRLTIISQVTGGYFTLVQQNYLLELQKQLVKDTLDQYTLAQGQYKEGYISLYALQTYQQNYEKAKAQVPIIESNIVASENAIKVLLNKNPGVVKTGVAFNKLPMDGIVPGNVPSVVLRQRPDVISAEDQLIAANAQIGVATASFFPSINLTGQAGSAASQLSGLFAGNADFWSTTVSASMPLLNLSYFGTIRQAKGQYYTAYYNYIFTVRNAFAQTDNALAAHQKYTDSYKEQKVFYDSTVLGFDLENQRFKDGLDSWVTALNNKITMDSAAITLANAKMSQLQTIVNLYQTMAGGYNVKNTESAVKFGDGHDAD